MRARERESMKPREVIAAGMSDEINTGKREEIDAGRIVPLCVSAFFL